MKGTFVFILAVLVALVQTMVEGFSVSARHSTCFRRSLVLLRAGEDDREEKLNELGFSEKELKQSRREDNEEIKVNVNIIPDVDPVTLTAIGFALIAFNFLVFANMGDAGIAGAVATIINKLNEQ